MDFKCDELISEKTDADSRALTTYLFIPSMLAKRNGGVINAASTAAFQPLPYIAIVWGLESICVKSDGSPRG